MLRSKQVVPIVAAILSNIAVMGSASAQDVQNDEASKKCVAATIACATAAVGEAKGIADAIKQCKPLRECKKDCREEKRDCKQEARGGKRSCKDECRDKFQHGKDYRECADACRDEKKEAKGECKETVMVCKDTCRDEFKSPECQNARRLIVTGGLSAVPTCAVVVQCVLQSTSQPTP